MYSRFDATFLLIAKITFLGNEKKTLLYSKCKTCTVHLYLYKNMNSNFSLQYLWTTIKFYKFYPQDSMLGPHCLVTLSSTASMALQMQFRSSEARNLVTFHFSMNCPVCSISLLPYFFLFWASHLAFWAIFPIWFLHVQVVKSGAQYSKICYKTNK